MKQAILVIGAGMVGTCTALELQLRGHTVTLLDKRLPGQETSYGNAGVIQREAVEPYPMPRGVGFLLAAALGRDPSVSYHPAAMLAVLPRLWQYWRASAPGRHSAISRHYAALIAHSTSEHARLMRLADADDLVRRSGLRLAFRSGKPLAQALADAARLQRDYGISFQALDGAELARVEPAFRRTLAGAVHWSDSWSVTDPGRLVERYAALFQRSGGRLVRGDGATLRRRGTAWQVDSADGIIDAAQTVVALGPWANSLTRSLGYRLPLFVKRGYHRHYADGAMPSVPTLDAERGYVMSPQSRGLRITTGAEIAAIDARPTPRQLALAEASARELLDLGEPVEPDPWMGCRPCVADMLPIIGPAGHHPNLWFNFGHGHQGFTLGPASARLLADLIEGIAPFIPANGYAPQRFAGN